MLPSKRPYLADEELGKKDDDHRPRTGQKQLWRAKQWRAPRPRRLIIGIILLCLLYLFFKNMPTDLPPAVERLHPGFTQARQSGGKSWPPTMPSSVTPAKGPPPRADSQTNIKEDFYYEGEIRFNALARTLQRFWKPPTRHGGSISRAVVFAGSNLRSVSDLLPLACRMADQKINEVHFVLMGRDDVSIEGIQRVNDINEVDCPIIWHDSRPDYAQWSTETRMERAVTAGLSYVHSYTRSRVLITQGETWEDRFFTEGVGRKISKSEVTHISLPTAARNVMWISMLDSDALKGDLTAMWQSSQHANV
ncbi:hypothetical protein CNMCM5793_003588 [Aspergillus hiratsukae]|uniref:Uncharacterized protein n=1 Tax=Aspergillus hiratsukae TaxID=1194566 RepID=A0A8H6UY96_9EURO|nr:hypothetical protein CNMCM5793_003588 [Aspergillus hiratsukae]KAF7168644.1 hypothetical protein CNMCM6106_003784 [Aspergillus hiratsukae]